MITLNVYSFMCNCTEIQCTSAMLYKRKCLLVNKDKKNACSFIATSNFLSLCVCKGVNMNPKNCIFVTQIYQHLASLSFYSLEKEDIYNTHNKSDTRLVNCGHVITTKEVLHLPPSPLTYIMNFAMPDMEMCLIYR